MSSGLKLKLDSIIVVLLCVLFVKNLYEVFTLKVVTEK